MPRRRAPLFVAYAVASGVYSYLMLFVVVRFSYNVTSKLMAEFALIPAGALAIAIFRSRLKSLWDVVKQFWTAHLSRGFWLRPRTLVIGGVVLVLLFVPMLRDRESAYFVVEAANPVTLHATVNGRVDAVYVREGEEVRRGEPLLRMSSTDVAAMGSSARASMGEAHYHAFAAELAGESIGTAAAREAAARRSRGLADEAADSLVSAGHGGWAGADGAAGVAGGAEGGVG